MTTNTTTTNHVDALMEKAQVFASSWALVGSHFDDGSELENAEEQKRELRTMIAEALVTKGESNV